MKTIRSIHYPCISSSSNPYNDLLVDALNKQGISSQACNSIAILCLAVLGRKVSTVHFHWLDRAGGRFSIRTLKLAWQLTIICLLLFARIFNMNTVWTVHDLKAHNSGNQQFFFYRLVASLVNSLIGHSPNAVDSISSSYDVSQAKVHFIPHGLYPRAFDVSAENILNASPYSSKLRLIYFGHVSPYKGLDILASALQIASKRLGDQSPDITIIGNLNRSKYPLLAAQLGQCSNLKIISKFVDYDSLNKYLEKADLVVLPFRYTLTSGSLVYALSAGKPVLVSSIDSLAYYLSPSFSFTFEPNSAISLAEQLVLICNNYSARKLQSMGVLARRFAMTLDWDTVARQTSSLYR
jgi:beta-1,4-mannosyltransferase